MKVFISISMSLFFISNAWSQNVGIGTDTPTEKLEVVGGKIKIDNDGRGLLQTNGNTSVGTYVDANAGGLGTFSQHPLLFFIHDSSAASLSIGNNGNVGVGNTNPGDNAILDISSNNKGLMLPRLHDTADVASPTEGLFIYDKQTKSPSYHDGVKWRSLNNANAISAINVSPDDSVTYILAGRELAISSFSQSGSRLVDSTTGLPLSNPRAALFLFTKKYDLNSSTLKSYFYNSPTTIRPSITFNFFKRNETTPFYTIEFKMFYVIAISDSWNGAEGLVQSYTITAKDIEFHDINNGDEAQVHNPWP